MVAIDEIDLSDAILESECQELRPIHFMGCVYNHGAKCGAIVVLDRARELAKMSDPDVKPYSILSHHKLVSISNYDVFLDQVKKLFDQSEPTRIVIDTKWMADYLMMKDYPAIYASSQSLSKGIASELIYGLECSRLKLSEHSYAHKVLKTARIEYVGNFVVLRSDVPMDRVFLDTLVYTYWYSRRPATPRFVE